MSKETTKKALESCPNCPSARTREHCPDCGIHKESHGIPAHARHKYRSTPQKVD